MSRIGLDSGKPVASHALMRGIHRRRDELYTVSLKNVPLYVALYIQCFVTGGCLTFMYGTSINRNEYSTYMMV